MAIDVVTLSRLQFAITALYHFLFVPLTLGLSVMVAIMETIYVMTGNTIWKEMTKFWGILFGINFAMGVATGITMEFQFGTNWAYFSQYVGDIFGVPLAIEGLMAFFLEATFVGMFFFGWKRLSKVGHLIVTWLVAIGSSLSAMWILVANGWMNNPIGSAFNPETLRMEITSFPELYFNPVAQTKFVHTISAGYVTAAMFVLSISAYYLLRNRNFEFAKRSITVAASFGLATALSVVVLGDESGYFANDLQHMKVAAIEGLWHTEPAPASFTLFGIPDFEAKETKYAIKVPYVLGILATRSFDTPLPGVVDLVEQAKPKIQNGIKAYDALQTLQKDPKDPQALAIMQQHGRVLGYGLLLKKFIDDPRLATDEDIDKAAWTLAPHHMMSLFFAFRIMVLCGLYFIALFACAFYLVIKRNVRQRWFLWIAMLSLPLPWLAIELGWFVAEYGRQPWVIEGILPTFLGVSSITATHVWVSLLGFVAFYTVLAVIELRLMKKYVKLGPEGTTHLIKEDV